MTPTTEDHDVDIEEGSDEAPVADTDPADADTDASTETAMTAEAVGPLGTVESWAKNHDTKDWLFAGAKAGQRWAIGQELTETAYLAAIHAAANVSCR